METFLINYDEQILGTLILVVILLVLKFLGAKAIKKVGKLSDIHEVRTRLIIKFSNITITFVGIVALTFIWGVDFQKLGLIFSSVFAVIGVALFAQWSILSNITSGIILFFSFPFKIGDRIKIMDKEIDLNDEIFFIDDIRGFHVHLRRTNGELMTYPNNLMLQKAVVLIQTYEDSKDSTDDL
ncbi:mechanosensitive ion channel [Arenibacter sp. 6A1]|uniref:mechanosensitive ion channel domain-containing protein n=1 Tax=Arenibacter sp. 6A1 TaxID=2720391 RepID=UPI001444C24E|nr:mechanosensitive ion channel domain-containing protein [Arenibacter sp. 6A1]NKI26900.1 mechanosensitive ion channel [Arenibacter sp. 6A1]